MSIAHTPCVTSGAPRGLGSYSVPVPEDTAEFLKACFLLRASVRWSLVELEEMTLDEAVSGLVPAFEACSNDTFDELVETLASQRRDERPGVTRTRALEKEVALGGLYAELNGPRNHPTAQSVVEAILHCVRERGLAALEEPDNVERLRRCDPAALAQINERISKILGTANDQ